MARAIKRASLRLLEQRLFWAALIVTIFAANAVWCFRNRVNGDVAWYLYAVSRLREGASLYVDIHDINLPLVYLIYLPLAWISQLSGVPISIVMYGALWALVAVVLFAIYRMPRISFAGRSCLAVATAYGALSLHRRDLGQRDPLCALLFTFLVVSLYAQIKRPGRRPWAGWCMIAAASAGIAIKPFFLAPWLLVTLWAAYHCGFRQAMCLPEVYLPATVSILSWIVTLTLFPGYLRMAAEASRYYNALNGSPWLLVPLLIPAPIAVFAFFRKTGRIGPLVTLSALVTTGFIVECLVQRKAFPYHLAPALSWCTLTAGALFVDAFQRFSGSPARWGAPFAAGMGAACLAAQSVWSAVVPPPEFPKTQVDRFVAAHAQGKLVLSLSTDLWTAYPLILESGARNARKDASLWTLPGMYLDQVNQAAASPVPIPARYHSRAEMSDDERACFDQVVGIITGSHPSIIVVQTGRWKQGMRGLAFDFLDYFGSDPQFRAALRGYERGPADEKRLVLIAKPL